MEDNKHTQGELELLYPKIRAKGGGTKFIAQVFVIDNYEPVSFAPKKDVEAEANAERLVKCWNEYDTLVKERELLIEALDEIINDNSTWESLWLTDKGWDKLNKAKELLNNLQK